MCSSSSSMIIHGIEKYIFRTQKGLSHWPICSYKYLVKENLRKTDVHLPFSCMIFVADSWVEAEVNWGFGELSLMWVEMGSWWVEMTLKLKKWDTWRLFPSISGPILLKARALSKWTIGSSQLLKTLDSLFLTKISLQKIIIRVKLVENFKENTYFCWN